MGPSGERRASLRGRPASAVGAAPPSAATAIEKPAELRGRAAEWARLNELLRFPADAGSDTPAKVIVLAGPAGVGKGTLARAALRAASDRFAVTGELDGSCSLALKASMRTWATQALGLAHVVSSYLGEAIRTSLRQRDRAWALLVTDVNGEDTRESLSAALPTTGGCLIVTTTDARIWTDAAGAVVITLAPLDAADYPPDAAVAVARLGGLPLWVGLAQAYATQMALANATGRRARRGPAAHADGQAALVHRATAAVRGRRVGCRRDQPADAVEPRDGVEVAHERELVLDAAQLGAGRVRRGAHGKALARGGAVRLVGAVLRRLEQAHNGDAGPVARQHRGDRLLGDRGGLKEPLAGRHGS